MALVLRPDDERLTWQGAISLHRQGSWTMPWRIPFEQRALYPPLGLHERASMPAGVRISFHTDSHAIGGTTVPHPESSPIDLYCDGMFHGTVDASTGEFQFDHLVDGDKLVELWMPHTTEIRLRQLEFDGSSVEPYEDIRPKWVTYGSSISHCRQAERPGETWPAIVAREHNLNLTGLGFGGQCHLEPMIARMMADLEADYISMKVGINIYAISSLSTRTFGPATIGFVHILRDRHPDTPLVVASPIISPEREESPNDVAMTLREVRQEIAEAVETMKATGDQNIHYVDGLRILGQNEADLLVDGLHPGPEGYRAMARNFLREVARPIFI